MPAISKIDRLDPELRSKLNELLIDLNFSQYDFVTEQLNGWLEDRGDELRISKTSVFTHGQAEKEYARVQERANGWAENWMQDNGLEKEAKRHNVLFQMLTTLAFKAMEARIDNPGEEIDVKELHFVGRMLKDVMSSAGIREKLLTDEREKGAKQARDEAAEQLDAKAKTLGLTAKTVQDIRAEILGVARDA